VTNFVHALIAVIVGNIVYFLLVPYLPPAAHQRACPMGLGMVGSFWFCLAVLGIVKMAARRRELSKSR